MKKIFLLILFIAVSFSAFTQKATIKGYVTDESGEPLTGANVIITNTLQGTATNSSGEFTLQVNLVKNYMLTVSYIGYDNESFTVSAPYKEQYHIELSPSPFIADDIVVKSTRAGNKTPMAYKNLSKEELKAQNMGQDLAYLISLTPSVVQSSESGTGIGYTNFRIRGTDPSRINITVDGIPLNDAESQQVFWVNMPAFSNSLNSIQIQRGVGTSTNGAAAFGASVNMQTESPAKEAYADISSTFGSYNTFLNTVKVGTGLFKDKLAFDFRYSKMNSDGYIDYASSDNESMQFTGTYYTKKGRIKANVILGEQHTGISWWGIDKSMINDPELRTYNPAGQYVTPEGEERYYEDQTDNYWQNHYHLVYSSELSENLTMNLAAFYVDGEGYYEQFKQEHELAEYYLPDILIENDTIRSTDLARQKWLKNSFYGGVFSFNYTKDLLNLTLGGGLNNYVGDHFGRIIWMRYAGNTEKEHIWYTNDASKLDGNLYIKANYEAGDRLNLFADVQFRYVNYRLAGLDDDVMNRQLDQQHSFSFLNPKLGAQFLIDENSKVYASYAIGNREPTRQNFKDATGDPLSTPKAEELSDLEIGYSYSSEPLSALVNFYYMSYENQLVPTGELSVDGYPVMTNVYDSYRRGIEMSFGLKPVSILSWNANLTLSQNRIKDFVESYIDYDDEWNPIPSSRNLGTVDIAYSPSVIASSDLAIYPVNGLGLHLISQFVSKQYFVNTMNENMMIDRWFVNNLRLDYSFPIDKIGVVALQVQVNNLFDKLYANNAYGGTWWEEGTEYYWSAYFPQATRNILMKVNVRF